MSGKLFLKRIIYRLADIPLLGIPFVLLLKLRKKIQAKTKINNRRNNDSVLFDYHEEALRGIVQCIERHEIRLRELEEKIGK